MVCFSQRTVDAELEAERYETSKGWGLYDGSEAPALVDFWRGTIALIWRFGNALLQLTSPKVMGGPALL